MDKKRGRGNNEEHMKNARLAQTYSKSIYSNPLLFINLRSIEHLPPIIIFKLGFGWRGMGRVEQG